MTQFQSQVLADFTDIAILLAIIAVCSIITMCCVIWMTSKHGK